MNALEMAEAMEERARVRRKITNRENTGDRLSDQLEKAATMLRQQQEKLTKYELRHEEQRKRIDELEAQIKTIMEANTRSRP